IAVPLAGVSVTAAVTAGRGTLGGGTAVATNDEGVAVFTDLFISGATGTQTIAFSSGDLTVATATVSVSPAVSKLGFDVAPSANATNHVQFATQPVVELEDASGNPVAQSGVVVSASIQSGDG